MKIRPEHYAALRNAIAEIPLDTLRNHRANLVNDPRVNDLDKRLRWDALHCVRIDGAPSYRFTCDTLYPYMNDTHIDTALRAIFTELGV